MRRSRLVDVVDVDASALREYETRLVSSLGAQPNGDGVREFIHPIQGFGWHLFFVTKALCLPAHRTVVRLHVADARCLHADLGYRADLAPGHCHSTTPCLALLDFSLSQIVNGRTGTKELLVDLLCLAMHGCFNRPCNEFAVTSENSPCLRTTMCLAGRRWHPIRANPSTP